LKNQYLYNVSWCVLELLWKQIEDWADYHILIADWQKKNNQCVVILTSSGALFVVFVPISKSEGSLFIFLDLVDWERGYIRNCVWKKKNSLVETFSLVLEVWCSSLAFTVSFLDEGFPRCSDCASTRRKDPGAAICNSSTKTSESAAPQVEVEMGFSRGFSFCLLRSQEDVYVPAAGPFPCQPRVRKLEQQVLKRSFFAFSSTRDVERTRVPEWVEQKLWAMRFWLLSEVSRWKWANT
jgi:hypothetical protein